MWRCSSKSGDFTPRLTLGPAGTAFTGPVALLTDRRSYSATEEFVLMMDVLPTVTIVGDSPGGGSGNPLVRESPNGWTYRFSQWLMYTPGGDLFEETGLPPDVWVRGSNAALQAGRDAMLDTALAVVRRASAR